jgi:hypothetical protein
MVELLSNGDMYDPRRGLYMHINKEKPHPQNRQQIDLTRLRVQKLADLEDAELDHLLNESRRLVRQPVKSLEYEPWYVKHTSRIKREHVIRGLQHDYFWEWHMTTHMKYTREQLDNMPYNERQHKKHERQSVPEFWCWLETSRHNQYHALWGRRKTLPGVARSMKARYNRKINNKQRSKNVTSKNKRFHRLSRTRIVNHAESS